MVDIGHKPHNLRQNNVHRHGGPSRAASPSASAGRADHSVSGKRNNTQNREATHFYIVSIFARPIVIHVKRDEAKHRDIKYNMPTRIDAGEAVLPKIN